MQTFIYFHVEIWFLKKKFVIKQAKMIPLPCSKVTKALYICYLASHKEKAAR